MAWGGSPKGDSSSGKRRGVISADALSLPLEFASTQYIVVDPGRIESGGLYPVCPHSVDPSNAASREARCLICPAPKAVQNNVPRTELNNFLLSRPPSPLSAVRCRLQSRFVSVFSPVWVDRFPTIGLQVSSTAGPSLASRSDSVVGFRSVRTFLSLVSSGGVPTEQTAQTVSQPLSLTLQAQQYPTST